MALDSNDKVHIAHGDYTCHVLNYVFVDPEALPPPVPVPDPVPPTPPSPFTTPASPAGTIKIVDSSGNVGTYSSLALDAEGNPHISYCDGNCGLKHAYCNGTMWHVESVDYNGWPGLYSSIAIDPYGNPCISYYDNWDGELRYTAWNGSSWNTQVVDSPGGGFTSLAIDSEGNPHISYYDITNGDLKYASWTSSGWNIQTVDSAGDVGWSTSLKLDSSDNSHISYLDSTSTQLKYAVWTGLGWDIQVVDSVGNANFFQTWLNCTSLALDSSGYPRISYFDGVNSSLKYALWNGSSWVIQTVDSSYNVGWSSSLALDSSGRAHISYYDATVGDLKYVCSQNAIGFSPQSTPGSSSTLHQEKMMSFLSDIVGLDLTKYTLTPRTLPQSSFIGVPLDANEIILSSNQSCMRVFFDFLNGNVRRVSFLDNTGVPHMKKSVGTPFEMTKDFMSNYQAFTGDSFYGTLRSMLDSVSGEEDYTQTLGNVKFDLFIEDDGSYQVFGWTYTYNGVNAIQKGVFLSYQNGSLTMFMDNWSLYTIGNTVINLSEEEAKSIAVNASKKYGHELSGAVNATLFFCLAHSADKPRGQDPLTFYLAWRVEVEYAKWSDSVTGIIVDIWADTKEIIRVREAKIMIKNSPFSETSPSPDPTPTPAPSPSPSNGSFKSSSPTTDPTPIPTAPEFTPWIALPLLIIATLFGGLIYRKEIINGGEA
jgi:hypothetical protein